MYFLKCDSNQHLSLCPISIFCLSMELFINSVINSVTCGFCYFKLYRALWILVCFSFVLEHFDTVCKPVFKIVNSFAPVSFLGSHFLSC